jgi:Permeases of the drug/metabolite transporter (DMT) superfamily
MTSITANLLGIASLLLWCMNVAVTRHISEAHPFGMPGLSFSIAGILLIIVDLLRRKPFPWQSDALPKFWLWGGGAYILYLLLYASGLAYSDSRDVVLPLGLINYLWPSLILVMMPLFFRCRIKTGILTSGIILCVAGVASSLLWGLSLAEITTVFWQNWPAFAMMGASAFLWAFYSNAARKWAGTANGVGWFFLATGLCFLALWQVTGGPLGLSRETLGPLFVHAVCVNAIAYFFWDCGVRWGDIGLMGALANFLPIGSIVFGVWYLGNAATPGLWIGGALVTAGAILCRKGCSMHMD